MAAEFLITFSVQQLIKKVGSVAVDETIRIWGLKKDLENLNRSVTRILSFLQEAEEKSSDGRVKHWLVNLQDVIYSAEDVLDEFSYEILRRKIEIGDQPRQNICSYLLCGYNPISFRRQISNKVKKINESLADIEKKAVAELALKAAIGANRRGDWIKQYDDMGTHSLIDESKPPVGRRKELENITSFIKEKSSSHDLKFVCIAGFGGLGKTTLAKMVCAEAKRDELFDVITWVDVSKTSSATMILRDMLQEVDPSLVVSTNLNSIIVRLKENLQEKTFLLVLDNVWKEQSTDWLNLEKNLSLISNRNGNSIIMTTRITELSSVMSSSYQRLVELQELSDDECWSIIKVKAFGKGEKFPVPEGLQNIGFDIAKNCKGVPLVADVVGGILRSKEDIKEWEILRDSDGLQAIEVNNILPGLKLSFDNLPPVSSNALRIVPFFQRSFFLKKKS